MFFALLCEILWAPLWYNLLNNYSVKFLKESAKIHKGNIQITFKVKDRWNIDVISNNQITLSFRFLIFTIHKPIIMPGGGGGFILDMIYTLEKNAALLRRRKFMSELIKYNARIYKHYDLNFKTASPEELKAFHQEVIRQSRRSFRIQVSLAVFFMILAVVVTIVFIKMIT